MKKWVRRSLLTLSALVATLAVLSVALVWLFRATPSWYAPQQRAAAQQQQLAQAAENKMIAAQNWAAELRADAVRNARALETGATRPATRAAGSHIVQFSQDELNALFDKWSVLYGWSNKYRKFIEAPTLVLRDGRLILAGKVHELGSVVSVQLQPKIDDKGRLRLDLVKVSGGKLPLPDSVWTSYREQMASSIRRQMPRWQGGAMINRNGAANTAAMTAAMGQLFLQATSRESAEPVLFLPLADKGDSVPVKLTDVAVEEGKLTLAVEPLTADERVSLLQRIRSTRN